VKDYYAILGVSSAATEAEIKKAFRKLAVQYHPDKNAHTGAKDLFQEVNEAYDILSDPDKRALYDSRRSNPFVAILTEPEPPRHRDPAYRRKNPAPPFKKEPPAVFVLMRDNLKYMMWVSRVGIFVSCLFFIDYFLPYHVVEEGIREIRVARQHRRISHHVLVTSSGREVKLQDDRGEFFNEDSIKTVISTIYRSTVFISNMSETVVVEVGFLYGSLIFFPILLFINSFLALILKHRVELSFNLNLVGVVLLIINFVFI
jgi:curved DNA-binding protein CbpA